MRKKHAFKCITYFVLLGVEVLEIKHFMACSWLQMMVWPFTIRQIIAKNPSQVMQSEEKHVAQLRRVERLRF